MCIVVRLFPPCNASEPEVYVVGFVPLSHCALTIQRTSKYPTCLVRVGPTTFHSSCLLPHPSLVRRPGGKACAPGLRVAGGFLDELYAAGEAEFGVDVGEVGLHGAW